MTLETPPWLWAASGVRALDHAVETIYSSRHHPLSDAAAAHGLSMLVKHLPPSLSTTGAEQLEHRLQCQLGAWLSVFGVTNAGLGLSHALGHQIGPRWDVPHGVTSCITLPHAMRYMATRAPERFGPIAQAFGLSFDVANAKNVALSPFCRPDDSFHRPVRASSTASRCARAARGDPRSCRTRPRHPRQRAGERSPGQFRAAGVDANCGLLERPSFRGQPASFHQGRPRTRILCSVRTFFRIAITPLRLLSTRGTPMARVVETILPTTMVGSYPRPHWFTHQLLRSRYTRGFQGSAARRGVHRRGRDSDPRPGGSRSRHRHRWQHVYDDYVGSIGSFCWYMYERIPGFEAAREEHPSSSTRKRASARRCSTTGAVSSTAAL